MEAPAEISAFAVYNSAKKTKKGKNSGIIKKKNSGIVKKKDKTMKLKPHDVLIEELMANAIAGLQGANKSDSKKKKDKSKSEAKRNESKKFFIFPNGFESSHSLKNVTVKPKKDKSKEKKNSTKSNDLSSLQNGTLLSREFESAATKLQSEQQSTPLATSKKVNRSQKVNQQLNNPGKTPVKAKTPVKPIKTEPPSTPAVAPPNSNSVNDGAKLLEWILTPISIRKFLSKYWEKSPCLIQRDEKNYFSSLISFQAIDQMLLNHHVEFTENIDITSYQNGERSTLNPEGRATPAVVWENYSNGCSVRLLNPQTFLPSVYSMNTTLQEYFHCMVGANVYLTPPNSQGFAPHFDDIEAFVLQIEGQKRWKVYYPRSQNETLPRVSSGNFKQDEIGSPVIDVVLKPGDVLYFPRGMIHQACTQPGHHSLHITLSVYQKHSFADLLELLMPQVLSTAIANDIEMRQGLPLNIWRNMGIAFSDSESKERTEIVTTLKKLVNRVCRQSEELLDDAVDQMAKRFQHDALPPEITSREKSRTVFGSKTTVGRDGLPKASYEIDLGTSVRLLRANILRIVQEEGTIRLYYYVDNSREYHEYDPNYIEIEEEDARAVEHLIKVYPEYVSVRHLEVDDDRKIPVVRALWERGLLISEKPIN